MSARISQWIGLIGIAATIPLVQTVAVAKSAVEIGEIATSITVLITNSSGGNGSGVILQRQGDIYTVLTVAHVMNKNVSYKINTPDGRQYDVIDSSIVPAPGDIDLAVVKFRSTTNYPTAKLGNCNLIKLGMEVYVAGFSGTTLGRTTPVLDFKEGKVSSNSYQTQARGYSLMYDNNTMPGMSGGTVLNSNGELIAIHGVGDKDRDGTRTGTNMAIPINRFATVANVMGVELNGRVAAIPKNTTRTAQDYFASGVSKITPPSNIELAIRTTLDYQGALSDFNRAIQLDPNYAQAYLRRAWLKSDDLKDYKGALADCSRVIQFNPIDHTLYRYRSGLRDELKDYKGALSDLNIAIKLGSNLKSTYRYSAYLKRKLNDIQGALADYDRAIELINDGMVYDGMVYADRGSLKAEKLNDIRGALADYDRSLQLVPNSSNYAERGLLKAEKLNDTQGALADYNRATELSYNADAYNYRGLLRENKLNDIQGALADYNRAIEIRPNYDDPYFNRGVLKFDRLKDRSGGINDMKQALRLYRFQGKKQKYNRAINLLSKWQKTS